MLVSTLTAEELEKNKQLVLNFMIRRETGGKSVDLKATPETLLLPGDLVVVRIGDRGGTNVTSLPTNVASSPAQ